MDLYNSKIYIQDLREAIYNARGIEQLKGKHILITGATGTIGSFLVDMLNQYNQDYNANITIYAAARGLNNLKKKFKGKKSNLLLFVPYDTRQTVNFEFNVDYLIHAAGNAYPASFNADPVGTIISNIYGTFNLLEYGRAHGVQKFLYISSGEIYGQGDSNLDYFDENYGGYINPLFTRSCYPISKRAAENLCISYTTQYGLETVIVRPCHTYGPGMTMNDDRAHVQFFRNILKDENIIMKSAGNQMRSYSYIADCGAAIFTVLLNGKPGEAYNSATSDVKITIRGLAQIIAEITGKQVLTVAPDVVDLANRTPIEKQVLSSKKIEALGWKGRFSVERGIQHTINILRSVDKNEKNFDCN